MPFFFDEFNLGQKPISSTLVPFSKKDIIYSNNNASSKDEKLFRGWIRTARTNAIFSDDESNEVWISYFDSLYVYTDTGSVNIQVSSTGNLRACKIMKDDQRITWVATYEQGLFGLKDKKVVYEFNDPSFFGNALVRSMEIQGEIIWLATDKGVIKVHYPTGKIVRYDQLDGLVSNEVYDIAVFDDVVYVATSSGLVLFNADVNAINKVPPLVYLQQVKVNNVLIRINDQKENDLIIPYDKNSIEFKITGSSLRSRGAFHYKYRLLGLDSSWYQQPAQANFLRYQGLNSGSYTLEVISINEDGLQSKDVTRFSFVISKPFYQTIWFYLLLLVIVGLFIYLILQLRYQRIQNRLITKNSINQLKMQALQSQMNPHFVFNAMTAIQSFWIQDKKELALNYHAQFAKLMRLIFEYSKENKIHIEDEIEFLKLYLNLELMRFGNRIDVQFDYDPEILNKEIYIPPLILQPLIENSFKHGLLHKEGKGHLVIIMEIKEDYLYCSVEDDGVGIRNKESFTVKEKKRYSSTIVIKERLDILNGVEGVQKRKTVFAQTNNPNDQGGFRSEIWVPVNI